MNQPVTDAEESPRLALSLATVLLGVLGVVALVAALLVGEGNGTTSTSTSGEPKTFAITLADLSITPSSIDIPSGTDLTLDVTNKGAIAHNVTVDASTKTSDLAPGGTATLHVGVVKASTQYYCAIPGHKEAGMVLKVNVTGSSGQAAGMDMSEPTAGTPSGGDTNGDATIDFNAKPGPDWKPFDPHVAPAPGGTEHAVTFHMSEKVMEVAPGVTQQMWTFNGQVPGPVLRGKVGDTFTITLVNDGTMGHSIDFHASQTSMDQDMRTLQPGQSLVYQYKAQYSGIWMYHCGTAPVLHHIGNGMYGAVIIDPPDLAPVDHEYVVVQSELYTGPQGQPGDLSKMLVDKPDALMFNGYVNQYKSAPITDAKAGERIRVWVLDTGPNDPSSFHIVGTIFDTVFKEGAYLVRPGNADQGGSQALDLLPAQGGFVETTFAKPGMFVMVTHRFADASRGALGVFQVS